ncbi:glycosyltransferase [Prosthecobacter sp.]
MARAIHLTRAVSFAQSAALRQAAVGALRRAPGIEGQFEVWKAAVLDAPRHRERVTGGSPQLDRSIILKAPGPDGEKGILLMTFEYNWVRLLLGMDDAAWQAFEARYDLVLSTSWSPTDYAALALVLSRTSGRVFVQSCNYAEIPAIEAFHPRLRCLPTLPCDWINPRKYTPLPAAERDIDILMVANWGKFKRHWDLFQALARMPAGLKVVLVGQREPGRSQDTLRRLAADFGVPQTLEIHESVPIDEVTRLQCRAKVSVIMTRREGCCVAAVESLFAGCALAMRDDAHVGPRVYIQAETGAQLRPGHLAEDLTALIERSASLRPHQWAGRELAGPVSREKVNAFLQEQTLAQGRPWTRDICQPQWRPHPTFMHTEDMEALLPEYQGLHESCPRVFSAELAQNSWR